MNPQTMEGLIGAGTNIRMAGTPMSVYRLASTQGDQEKMKRALGYAGECVEKAEKYQEKIDKGLKAEAEAEREKAKLEQEVSGKKPEENRGEVENKTSADVPHAMDVVQISEAAKAEASLVSADVAAPADGPLTYRADCETVPLVESGPSVSVYA